MTDIEKQLEEFYNSWRKIDLQYDLYARSLGLSSTSMNVLYFIYKGNGTCTQTILREKTRLPKQTIHSAVLTFVKNGTVVLCESASNKKSKYLVLTKEGKEFCTKVFEKLDHAETDALFQFSDEERKHLIELLTQYATALEKALQ